jgi:sec-independent protein translocase protein TatA
MIGGIGVWQLLILLLIVALVFGTKRLRNIGSDLGSAIKGFRKGIEDVEEDSDPEKIASKDQPSTPSQNQQENAKASRPTNTDV